MSILSDVKDFLIERDLVVSVEDNTIYGLHSSLPISLNIVFKPSNLVDIGISVRDDLRETLIELIESGEDIRAIVDDVLSELRDTAIELQKFLSDKGFRVRLVLRDGESDVREVVDDVMEEYREVLEELGIEEEY